MDGVCRERRRSRALSRSFAPISRSSRSTPQDVRPSRTLSASASRSSSTPRAGCSIAPDGATRRISGASCSAARRSSGRRAGLLWRQELRDSLGSNPRPRRYSPISTSLCRPGSCAAARFLASFLAFFSNRRSRSLRSRLSFAIVVFLLPLEAMRVLPSCGVRARRRRARARRRRARARALRRSSKSVRLEHLDVRGCRALGALLGVVAHLRTLGQRLEAAALDRVVVHEQVLAGVIGCDESVALVVVEPLHGSCSHLCPSGICALRDAEGARTQRLRKRAALLWSNRCPTRRTRVALPRRADLGAWRRPPIFQGSRSSASASRRRSIALLTTACALRGEDLGEPRRDPRRGGRRALRERSKWALASSARAPIAAAAPARSWRSCFLSYGTEGHRFECCRARYLLGSSGSARQQPEVGRARGCLRSRAAAQLVEDAADVHVDRARAQDQALGDLAVRQARGNELHDLQLAP